jgi:hypothetical protein
MGILASQSTNDETDEISVFSAIQTTQEKNKEYLLKYVQIQIRHKLMCSWLVVEMFYSVKNLFNC